MCSCGEPMSTTVKVVTALMLMHFFDTWSVHPFHMDQNFSTKKFRIELWTFSFQIGFRNQFSTLGSGQTENYVNMRICVFPVWPLPKVKNLFRKQIWNKNAHISIFSKHRPSGPMLSIRWNVRLSVCLSVCVCSLLRYHLNVFLPPLPEVGCPIFLEIRNHWGKVMERSGLIFEHFCLKIVKKRRTKFFFCWFCLTKHGGNDASRLIRDLWSKGVSLILAYL